MSPSLTLILRPRASLYRKVSQRNLPRDRVCDNIFHLVPEAACPHRTGNQFLFRHWRPVWYFAIILFKLANAPLRFPNKVPKCYIMTPSEYHCLSNGSWNRQSMLQKSGLGTQYFSFGSIHTSVVTLRLDWFLYWSPEDRESMPKIFVAVWSIIRLRQYVYRTRKIWMQATQTI